MAEELEQKCKQCSRRFITKIGLECHSTDQHKKEKDTQQDEIFCEIACPVCNLYFGSAIELQLHRSNAHNEIITHRSNEFDSESSISFKPYLNQPHSSEFDVRVTILYFGPSSSIAIFTLKSSILTHFSVLMVS